MATGVLLESGYNDYFVNALHGASAPTGLLTPSGARGLYDPEGYPLVGAHTDTQPQDPATQVNGPGARIFSYSDDFHNTIHVRPIFVDVGSVVSTTVRFVEVWNGYIRDSRTLDSISVTTGDGIVVSGVALPYAFAPLESVIFEVQVSDEGPAVIAARYDLIFTTQEGEPYWQVIGRRVLEWSEPPNWKDPYEESLSFLTEVITAHDGTEQRIALRHQPRRSMTFTPLFQKDRDRNVRRWLATWQPRYFVMADWPRGVITGGAPLGGQVLVLEEPAPEISVGSLVVLRDPGGSTSAEVASVDELVVTLVAPLARQYAAGAKLFPALTVHLPVEVSARRYTANAGSLTANLQEAPRQGKLVTTPAAITWRDAEVFLTPPNWRASIDVSHTYPFETLDTNRGRFEYRLPQDFPRDVRKTTFLLRDRDAVRDLEAFFRRCRGRRGEFFAPTWDLDLVLPENATLLDGGTLLPLADDQEAGRPDSDFVYRNLFVRLTDGTTLLRQVESGVLGELGAFLVLDAPWPRNIEAEEVLALHWMPRWRLASDTLTILWRTDGVAEATLAMTTLKDAS